MSTVAKEVVLLFYRRTRTAYARAVLAKLAERSSFRFSVTGTEVLIEWDKVAEYQLWNYQEGQKHTPGKNPATDPRSGPHHTHSGSGSGSGSGTPNTSVPEGRASAHLRKQDQRPEPSYRPPYSSPIWAERDERERQIAQVKPDQAAQLPSELSEDSRPKRAPTWIPEPDDHSPLAMGQRRLLAARAKNGIQR